MGSCFCKDAVDDLLDRWSRHRFRTRLSSYNRTSIVKVVDPNVIDQLVMELLSLIASFVDIDEEAPVALVKLHLIADKEEGWYQVVTSLVNTIPLNDPLGPSAITIVFDDCPLPARSTVIKFTELFDLCAERAKTVTADVQAERNLCVALGCLAEKLAGPNSVAILTEKTLDYLVTFLIVRRDPRVCVFALIALEKFACTTESKLQIMDKFYQEKEHPLLLLEQLSDCEDCAWRQVGFCAKWALDNIFVLPNRPLSYQIVDMSCTNAMLNTQDVSEYLKLSADGLEGRCDSYSFESVRCTFKVNGGAWYYECLIITSGVMQIGWATKSSHFLNHDKCHSIWEKSVPSNILRSEVTFEYRYYAFELINKEGYGIGDDIFSVSYDGCRRLIWHEAKPSLVYEVPAWKPGDIVGCLIDLRVREVIFSLNGVRLRTCSEIFNTSREGFFAGASFMAFQQCRFNFGGEPFHYPPKDRLYRCFNDYGYIVPEEKKVVPRRIYLAKMRSTSDYDDCCTLCCDKRACCTLEPCMHNTFCLACTSHLTECPMCRAKIINILQAA